MSAVGPRPRLRPLSLGEVLDVSIKIVVANIGTLLRAVLVVVVPVEILSTALTADYTTSATTTTFDFSTSSQQTAQQSADQFDASLGGLAVSTLLRAIAALLVSAACFRIIASAYLGDRTDWRSSLAFATRNSGSVLWVGLLYMLAVMAGFVLLFVGSVWLFVAFAFSIPVLFVERLRGRHALARSFRLVRGRWWRTFFVLTIGFFLAAVISGIVQAVFVAGLLAGSDNDALVLTLSALSGIFALAVTTPFQAALLTVVYFDLRVRKEAFDLELLAQEIGAGSQRGESSPPPSFLPPDAGDVDRSTAPYWPPPPGWNPPPPGGDPPDAGPDLAGAP